MKRACDSYTTVNNLHFMNYLIGLVRSYFIKETTFFMAIEMLYLSFS